MAYETIPPEEAKTLMDSGDPYYLLDARTQDKFAAGHIAGAVMIPENEVAEKAEVAFPDKDRPVLVYCRSGRRSKIAAEELIKLGYSIRESNPQA